MARWWQVLRARPARLASSLHYVETFARQQDLTGEKSYSLMQFSLAVTYISRTLCKYHSPLPSHTHTHTHTYTHTHAHTHKHKGCAQHPLFAPQANEACTGEPDVGAEAGGVRPCSQEEGRGRLCMRPHKAHCF